MGQSQQRLEELLADIRWLRESIVSLGPVVPDWERTLSIGIVPASKEARDYANQRQELRSRMAVKWGEIQEDIVALGVPIYWGNLGSVMELAVARPGVLNSSLIPEGLSRARTALDIAEGRLLRRLKQLSEPEPINQPAQADEPTNLPVARTRANGKVFVVHGHDVALRESVARFLSRLDLKPVILQEEPNRGRTLIEKLEAQPDVSFAVVLMTPDDVGGKAVDPGQLPTLHPRVRQNVMLELGYFIGVLGRENVCILTVAELEMPSDYYGVVYISAASEDWGLRLARELKAAQFDVDLNKAL